MNTIKCRILSLVCLLLFSVITNAQVKNLKSEGNIEVYLSYGLLSSTEIVALGNNYPIQNYRMLPAWLTGAAMATVRYYINDRIAIGLSIGMDNLGGDVSNSNTAWFFLDPGETIGRYVRQQYTIAPELTIIYYKGRHVQLYGSAGLGMTIWTEKYTFNSDISGPTFYGLNGIVPANPYTYSGAYVNAQLTGFGVRVGTDWAFFAEAGVGYKGLMNIGISKRWVGAKAR